MNSLRVPLIVLASVYAILAVFGLFAVTAFDGGAWWERIPLLFHPPAAIALFWLLLTDRPTPTLSGITLALLLLGIIGGLAHSGAILGGLTPNGLGGMIPTDWWLPLVWAIVPLVSLPYVIHFLGGRREDTPRFAA